MSGNLEKAAIIILKNGGNGPNTVVKCHFNPTDFSISKSADWKSTTKKGQEVPNWEFQGGGVNELSLKLLFDTTLLEKAEKDVRKFTQPLWEAVSVDGTTKNPITKKGEPPHVLFTWGPTWGRAWGFEAVVTSITQDFVLFNQSGLPLRSNVTLKLKQVKEDNTFSKQNPTSGGNIGRLHLVREGDRIDLIANDYYKKPMLWRYIAEHNNIDDPHDLLPGQQLFIPDLP